MPNNYCRQYSIHITSKQLHKYGNERGAPKENLSLAGDAEKGDSGSGFVVKKSTPQGESHCCHHGKGKEGGGSFLGGDIGVGAYA